MILPFPLMLYGLAVVLAAGLVRGYSGFGASMIIVLGLSLILPASRIVPAVLLLEIIASAYLLPAVFKQVDWRSLRILLVGVVLGTPLGVYVLANLPDRWMRVAIAVLVIMLVPLLWKGVSWKREPGLLPTLSTGLVSGITNGSAAIGGPPVVLFYLSSPKGATISRASLIAFFLVTDIIAAIACAWSGLLSFETVQLSASLLIPLLIGLVLGARSFFKTDVNLFRKRVLALLLVMALVTLGQSIQALSSN
mgnify:FL=1